MVSGLVGRQDFSSRTGTDWRVFFNPQCPEQRHFFCFEVLLYEEFLNPVHLCTGIRCQRSARTRTRTAVTTGLDTGAGVSAPNAAGVGFGLMLILQLTLLPTLNWPNIAHETVSTGFLGSATVIHRFRGLPCD